MKKLLLISSVVIIIIIASFLRLYNINELPPGLYPDEAIYANNGVKAWETGDLKVFYPENNGREGLWPNIIGFFVIKFGHEPWVPRSVAAVFGILTVLGLYFLTKELLKLRLPVVRNVSEASEAWSPSEARSSDAERSRAALAAGASERPVPSDRKAEYISLLSSFFLAVSFWHINFSRIGFRAIMAPLFLTWGIYFLLASLNKLKFITLNNQNNQSPVQLTGQRVMFFSALGGIFFRFLFSTRLLH